MIEWVRGKGFVDSIACRCMVLVWENGLYAEDR